MVGRNEDDLRVAMVSNFLSSRKIREPRKAVGTRDLK